MLLLLLQGYKKDLATERADRAKTESQTIDMIRTMKNKWKSSENQKLDDLKKVRIVWNWRDETPIFSSAVSSRVYDLVSVNVCFPIPHLPVYEARTWLWTNFYLLGTFVLSADCRLERKAMEKKSSINIYGSLSVPIGELVWRTYKVSF